MGDVICGLVTSTRLIVGRSMKRQETTQTHAMFSITQKVLKLYTASAPPSPFHARCKKQGLEGNALCVGSVLYLLYGFIYLILNLVRWLY